MKLAPIILFVYNRKSHTERTIEALKKNHLADKSELFIYSDGPKNQGSIKDVNEVREYINNIQGFKIVKIIHNQKNFGLAKNIILGVTQIINRYGSVIVLEDDLVTSQFFLKFMNEALNFYKDKKRIWHISGWSVPIALKSKKDVYFYRVMNCWGWATWADKWKYFKKNNEIIKNFTTNDIKKFNLDETINFWRQLEHNKKGKINTWAIYWYASIFKNNGLCINPSISFVRNIGFDGSGTHTFSLNYDDNKLLNHNNKINFDDEIKEEKILIDQIKNYYIASKKSILTKLLERFVILSKKFFLYFIIKN